MGSAPYQLASTPSVTTRMVGVECEARLQFAPSNLLAGLRAIDLVRFPVQGCLQTLIDQRRPNVGEEARRDDARGEDVGPLLRIRPDMAEVLVCDDRQGQDRVVRDRLSLQNPDGIDECQFA